VSYGSDKKVVWLCRRNSTHEWKAAVKDRTGPNTSGCPVCCINKAEAALEVLAAQHPNVKAFRAQMVIETEDLGRPGHKRKLRLDGFVEHRSGNTGVIELDGPQHFKSVLAWGSQLTDLRDQLERDRSKNLWAMKQGHGLLRVSYLEYRQLEVWFNRFIEALAKGAAEPVLIVSNAGLYNSQKDAYGATSGRR
jgi:hypothetical protein